MESNVIDAVTLGGSVDAYNFSMWSLFLRADLVVKAVIFVLLAASIWAWAVIFEKVMSIRRLNESAASFESVFWSGNSLDDLYDRIGSQPKDPMSAIFVSAMQEWRRALARGISDSEALRVGLQERVDRVMQITTARELERMLTSLPTVDRESSNFSVTRSSTSSGAAPGYCVRTVKEG